MKTNHESASNDLPVHRLNILCAISLGAIAVLSALGQSYILYELGWQSHILRSITKAAGQQSLDQALCSSAVAIEASHSSALRPSYVASLRKAVGESRDVTLDVPHRASATARILSDAETHRRSAIGAAVVLLSKCSADGSIPTSSGEIEPLVRTIISEATLSRDRIGAAVAFSEAEAAHHFNRLVLFEFLLFVFVIVVLVLEGLFVINPAVKRIQVLMAEMSRSTREVKSNAARLEQSNKELQDFASVASHDLQEPLRKVHAFSDRLRTKYGATLDDQGRDYLDRIQNATRRMQTLINDLLTFSRVTTKGQPFVSTDLAAATRDVVNDLEVRIEQVKGRVEIGGLATLEADPLQVRQLMQNLIGNALKYHRPEEPPVVKVYTRAVEGDPSTADANGAGLCQIIVEDNGIGFDEVYKDRIFTIFQRLHGRTEYEGTGVGLAVCRKIAERHSGSITAKSTPGIGSTFIVTLPVRQPREATRDDQAA